MTFAPKAVAALIRAAHPTPPSLSPDPLIAHGERMVRDIIYGRPERVVEQPSPQLATDNPVQREMLRHLDRLGM